MVNFYKAWNKNGEKNIQVVVISGDQNDEGFRKSTEGMPWVALPLNFDKDKVAAVVPCTGYPTPGIINGTTGAVIDPDAFGKVQENSLSEWLSRM